MMNVVVPSNVNLLMTNIIGITQFDYIQKEWNPIALPLLKYDMEEHENIDKDHILSQTYDLGYYYHSFVLDLGSLSLFLFIYILYLVWMWCLVYPFSRCTGIGKKYYERLKSELVFTGLIDLILPAYLDYAIATFMNF